MGEIVCSPISLLLATLDAMVCTLQPSCVMVNRKNWNGDVGRGGG
jgi:hypothetical protein